MPTDRPWRYCAQRVSINRYNILQSIHPSSLAQAIPLPPLSSSIPIVTGASGNSFFAFALLFVSSFWRTAWPPTSFVLSLRPKISMSSEQCMAGGATYSLADTLLSVCTSRRSSLRVVWSESGILPLVSPLACLGAAMLKGRVIVLRSEVVTARRERVRKADMVVGFRGLGRSSWCCWCCSFDQKRYSSLVVCSLMYSYRKRTYIDVYLSHAHSMLLELGSGMLYERRSCSVIDL